MTFRKICLTLLTLALGVSCAYAKKKTPKFEPAHQLTADQAALVQKAVAQEKVIIKAIQQRTPLVETYIQDTRPDVKLYTVPVDDQYTLSRVDFGKGFFDKQYEVRDTKKSGFFKGSFSAIYRPHQGTGTRKALYLQSHRLHADDVPRPLGLRRAALCVQLCAPRVPWHRCGAGSSMSTPRSQAWAASTAASGSRIRTATWSASTAPTPVRTPTRIPATTSTSIAGG